MTIHFVGAGPGAPDLLTLRGRDLLARCPVCVFAGSTVARGILQHCPTGAELIDSAPLDLDAIIAVCRKAHDAGQDVARLHSGDLSIYSAMGEQLQRLRALGIPTTITPGVPAYAAAAAALECELTVPGLAQSLVLTRMPGRASTMPPRETLANFAASGATLAIHLAIQSIGRIVAELVPFYGANCPVAVVFRASWPEQRILQAPLGEIEAALSADSIERSAIILVGPALAAGETGQSALYSSFYPRRFRDDAISALPSRAP